MRQLLAAEGKIRTEHLSLWNSPFALTLGRACDVRGVRRAVSAGDQKVGRPRQLQDALHFAVLCSRSMRALCSARDPPLTLHVQLKKPVIA